MKAQVTLPDQAPFVASITHEDSVDRKMFRVTIGFRGRVVPPKGLVTIRWECVIPASVMRDDDYWVIPFLFQAPARRMTLEKRTPMTPDEVQALFAASSRSERP
jgi:hypothetical protein